MGFSGVKNPAANAGDEDSIPELGRSPGEGNGYPLQYSCLENPMDREACQAAVYGFARVRYDSAAKHHQQQQSITTVHLTNHKSNTWSCTQEFRNIYRNTELFQTQQDKTDDVRNLIKKMDQACKETIRKDTSHN